jgi:2-dehydro-3-deoxygalactonokinase
VGQEGGGVAAIGVDWGTSTLRAYAVGADGSTVASVSSAAGVHAVERSALLPALDRLIQPWRARWPEAPVVISGMAGSREGVVEAPYVDTPAAADDLAAALAELSLPDGGRALVVPGLRHRTRGRVDVMRGEETQVVGVLAGDPDGDEARVVLPGTHSKWVEVGAGAVRGFSTYLTGELFALLTRHSTLAPLLPPDPAGPPEPAAFDAGLDRAADGQLLRDLFGARARCLSGELGRHELRDWISGLLIGAEIRQATAAYGQGPVRVVADRGLADRYLGALGRRGIRARTLAPEVIGWGYLAVLGAAGGRRRPIAGAHGRGGKP